MPADRQLSVSPRARESPPFYRSFLPHSKSSVRISQIANSHVEIVFCFFFLWWGKSERGWLNLVCSTAQPFRNRLFETQKLNTKITFYTVLRVITNPLFLRSKKYYHSSKTHCEWCFQLVFTSLSNISVYIVFFRVTFLKLPFFNIFYNLWRRLPFKLWRREEKQNSTLPFRSNQKMKGHRE